MLLKYTNDDKVIQEVSGYCNNAFAKNNNFEKMPSSLPDEIHIKDWYDYQKESISSSVFEVLKKKIVPLNFPIQKGISQNLNYRDAVLKGKPIHTIKEATGLQLENPNQLKLDFVKGHAGTLPILIIENPNDFLSILQALIYKNEPTFIPPSMGASMIKGLNNWHRLEVAIEKKRHSNLSMKSIQKEIIENKELYQDRLIIISKKPYSNIFPKDYNSKKWLAASLKLRIQHEYAHYLTLRFFGTMRNNMHDELLADYLGIHAIKDTFDASMFLHFIGLEKFPKYRKGGRLENYRGKPKLSDEAFRILGNIIYKSAIHIERFDNLLEKKKSDFDLLIRFFSITQFSLLELADENVVDLLKEKYFRQ